MPVETPSVFAHVIQEHLELKRRNSELDQNMPLERYSTADPFENHPLFKTESKRGSRRRWTERVHPVRAHWRASRLRPSRR